jgi:hypothetical protein
VWYIAGEITNKRKIKMNEKKVIISESIAKNSREVVYHNVGPDGKKDSITRHEPINPAKPVYKRTFGRRNAA